MTPISHALPADPPPPRTSARSPAERGRSVAPTCERPWSDLGRAVGFGIKVPQESLADDQ